MWRKFASSLVIPALCVLCFFTGTLMWNAETYNSQTGLEEVAPHEEGDSNPMPWPPVNQMPWECLPTGHEGN